MPDIVPPTIFPADVEAGIPNSPLPLIVAGSAVLPVPSPDAVHALLRGNGWRGTWTSTIDDFWHSHVTGHEVLVCAAGSARVGFGGPAGIALDMVPGDAVIVPAGVGHRRLSATPGFAVVGGYPPGQDGTVTRAGGMDLDAARQAIALLALPDADPLSGDSPGRLAAWRPPVGPRPVIRI